MSLWSVLLVLVASLATLSSAADSDYCKLCKQNPRCLYKENTPGKACKNYKGPNLSASDEQLIVRLHNEYRNKVALGKETRGKNGHAQPSASNMRKLSWDNELATNAQRVADQCVFEHSTCTNTIDGTPAGENLLTGGFAVGQTGPDWNATVYAWYEEVDLRDGRLNTKPFVADSTFEDVGHYTQMCWGETYGIGCGYSMYTAGSGSKIDTHLVVCHYKALGNNEGQAMYKAGKPATQCASGTKRDSAFLGLCA
ncbi:venom allergen 3-like isoform X3 [Frankliniella occidentalis]|uniref:Venom allergen 3-like isoform X3 n=1 Tax=Frankliniella occidentalis TaxID=133901 RepID=A0A9C6X6C1_FRAOC|nr:venom allergen 3-like isoform X3 [Frankliniella occidentalis]